MLLEIDTVMLEFVCKEAADVANKGGGFTADDVEALTPDRKNWKNSMAASRTCGGNICKRVAISITNQ